MWWLAAGIAVVVALAYLLRPRREKPTPEVAAAIEHGVRELQRLALGNILPDQSTGPKGLDRASLERQTVTAGDTVRFVYTVERSKAGFLHILSSKLAASKDRRYHLQCMLIALLTIHRTLAEAGIRPDEARFEMEESATGTEFISLFLAAGPNERLRMAAAAASAP